MPVAATCPNCKASYTLDEAARGKRLRCRRCQASWMPDSPATPRVESVERGGLAVAPLPPLTSNRWLWLAGGGVGLLLLACFVAGTVWWLTRSAEQSASAWLPPPAAPAPAVAAGDGMIPLAKLEEVKAATVFIKVEAPGGWASGSGFVMKVNDETAYIITNDHVVTPPDELLFTTRPSIFGPRRLPGRGKGKATHTAVFSSGTPREQTAPATVMATDPKRDLAILKVTGVRGLPTPLDFTSQPALIETSPVYIFGFPFGEMLATAKGHPAVTVGKGNVSSLRLDELGKLAVVQIDGDLNPGNSGGPVVDPQGRLVGVAVAKIKNTRIGLAIPNNQLAEMLNVKFAE
jgi:predicted Zn finger-like uncharacterized protein